MADSGNRVVVAEFQRREHGSRARLMESSGLSMSFDGIELVIGQLELPTATGGVGVLVVWWGAWQPSTPQLQVHPSSIPPAFTPQLGLSIAFY